MSQQWICVWCKAALHLDPEKGFVHPDGQVFAKVKGPDGVVFNDHCVLPLPPKSGVRR